MKSPSKKSARQPLASKLDIDPKLREGLIARITAAAQTTPVVVLHQIALMLEMNK